jgi:hypothetical protein
VRPVAVSLDRNQHGGVRMRTTKFLSIGGLMLTLVYAVPGYAAPPGDRCTPWPECRDDGGGDPPSGEIADNDTVAGWANTSPRISELAARTCWLESAQSNGDGGHYVCPLGTAVNFGLDPGQEIDKKGNPVVPSDALCSSMGTISMTPTHYPYNWAGDCTSSVGCRVRVRNWFANNDHPSPRVGVITVDGFATVAETSNPNPFADDFSGADAIQMDEVIITFKGAGTNRNEAVCRWSTLDYPGATDPGHLDALDVLFDSVPVP